MTQPRHPTKKHHLDDQCKENESTHIAKSCCQDALQLLICPSPSESSEFRFDIDDPQHLVDCGLATTYDEASVMLSMTDPDVFAPFFPILYENFRVRDFDNDPTRA